MRAGDLIMITKKWGKYWHMNQNIAGMVGTILRINEHKCEILLSNGEIFMHYSGHDAWLEVINDAA